MIGLSPPKPRKHSLELDPNVVIDGIHISERGCHARLQSHDPDGRLKAVVETDVSLGTSDDRPRASVYSFQREDAALWFWEMIA